MKIYKISFSLRGTGQNLPDKEFIENTQAKAQFLAEDWAMARQKVISKFPNAYNIFNC